MRLHKSFSSFKHKSDSKARKETKQTNTYRKPSNQSKNTSKQKQQSSQPRRQAPPTYAKFTQNKDGTTQIASTINSKSLSYKVVTSNSSLSERPSDRNEKSKRKTAALQKGNPIPKPRKAALQNRETKADKIRVEYDEGDSVQMVDPNVKILNSPVMSS
jgi:hypothetical protein